MTEFQSFPEDGGKRIVYVREIKTADLPDEIRARTGGLDHLYAIHAADGEVLALVPDRNQAFVVARQNAMSPVSVH
ncbi:MAG: DUF1150 family protein [Rhodobacteraceae bacterium]|nr:DUF1150 family protein [Paracoccaceae bacterium]